MVVAGRDRRRGFGVSTRLSPRRPPANVHASHITLACRPDMLKQGEPWFEDGNLVLIAEDHTGFRIHRGVLARQSEVFESMLSMPTPSSRTRESLLRTPDGCQTVEMHDKRQRVGHSARGYLRRRVRTTTSFSEVRGIAAWFPFTALGSFFCRSFHIQNLEDFFKTSAVLRLATKYLMKNIRRKTIKALTEAWAYTLEGHDQMVARAIADPQTEGQTSYPFVHPIHVVNLAREADVRLILPSALYFLSMYPFSDLQRADHPKLTAESRTGLPKPSSQLSYKDIGNYTLMYQHRIDFILKFCRNLNGRPPSPSLSPERALGGRSRGVLQGGFRSVGIPCFSFLAFAHGKFTLDVPDSEMVGEPRCQSVS